MHILKLRVVHRIMLVNLVDAFFKNEPHTLSELSKLMKLSDRLNFTPEERQILGVRAVKNEQTGREDIVWNLRKDGAEDGEEVDVERDVELSDEQKEMLYNVVKHMDGKKELNPAAAPVLLEIAAKIGYEV